MSPHQWVELQKSQQTVQDRFHGCLWRLTPVLISQNNYDTDLITGLGLYTQTFTQRRQCLTLSVKTHFTCSDWNVIDPLCPGGTIQAKSPCWKSPFNLGLYQSSCSCKGYITLIYFLPSRKFDQCQCSLHCYQSHSLFVQSFVCLELVELEFLIQRADYLSRTESTHQVPKKLCF